MQLRRSAAFVAFLAGTNSVSGQPATSPSQPYVPLPNPGNYAGGETYYYSYGQQPQCPTEICTERDMDCVQDVCEKYETGCASECVLYKTKYYEERMEPIIEEIDVCKEFETFEFTVCGTALNIEQCAEFETVPIQSCVQYETTTVNSCKRWETGLVAQCKVYDMDCYDECCEYETKKIDYCEKWDLDIWYINKKDDWYGKDKGEKGDYGGYGEGYRRGAESVDDGAADQAVSSRQAVAPEFVGMAGTPEQMAAFYASQQQQAVAQASASASASSPGQVTPPVGNDTSGDYMYDASKLTGSHYGGEVVVMKKLPEQCSCCEQKCAKTGCAEFPTRWCKKRKTKCARSERCKEYEYKYYDSPRCAEWVTKVVQGENCLQWQQVLYNTGVCKRYENKLYHGPNCARWGKLQYVSDKVQCAHVPYPSDECEVHKENGVLPCETMTPVCVQPKSICYPSTRCKAWGQCQAPTYSSLFAPGGQYGPDAPQLPEGHQTYRRSADASYPDGDEDGGDDRRTLDHIHQGAYSGVPGAKLSVYDNHETPPPPGNNVPSPPNFNPNSPAPGRFDYKYYETGSGLYNNFAYNPNPYHPIHEEEYHASKDALRDWIDRVHDWKYAKANGEVAENPPYFVITNRDDAYGPGVFGPGPKRNRWNKKQKPAPLPPAKGAVPVRVVIPHDDDEHDIEYGKHAPARVLAHEDHIGAQRDGDYGKGGGYRNDGGYGKSAYPSGY